MKHFAFLFVAALFPGLLSAEAGCPANVKAIPFHNVDKHQLVVAVSINNLGPFDFLLDTGTQMTVVDFTLAADLHLKSTGDATVSGASFHGPAVYARLDRLELGGHASSNQNVLLYNMKSVQQDGFAIRGLLGEDFLSGYDVLIDKAQNILCIDDTGAMLGSMRGEHVQAASHGGR